MACVSFILMKVLNIGAFSVKSSGLCHCAVLEESYGISKDLACSKSSETSSNNM
jgi:hypothetical protein